MYRSDIRKAAALLLILMLTAVLLPVTAAVIPAPSISFYVNDLAGILTKENKDHIVSVNAELYQKTGAQVVVVTMDTLDGDSLEQFATDMFRSYGIGSREKDNGILLLVVKNDRDIRLEVGYGLEGAITDGKAGRILDTYVIPYLKQDLWSEGIISGFDAVVQAICGEYGVTVDNCSPSEYKEPEKEWYEKWDILIMLAMGVTGLTGAFFGSVLPNKSRYGIIPTLIIAGYLFNDGFGGWVAALAVFCCGLSSVIGWAITSPSPGGGSGSYGGGHSGRRYSSGSSYSSYSHSSSYSSSRSSSSSSSHSGGGGRSGGGGASRKF